MTDESDCSEDDCIVLHQIPWRSQGTEIYLYVANNNYYLHIFKTELNLWMEELDQRFKKKLEGKSCTTPSRKRKIGSPSTSSPPSDAPKWAVDPNWNTNLGTYVHSYLPIISGITLDNAETEAGENTSNAEKGTIIINFLIKRRVQLNYTFYYRYRGCC